MANVTVTLTSTDVNVNTSTNNVTITNTPSNIVVSELPIISNTTVRSAFSNVDPILYDQANGIFSINNTTLLSGQTTSNLTEGTNLYFSNTNLATSSTTHLPEGTNLYLNGAGTTDDLTEGSANLYFTTDRANTNSDAWIGTKTTDDLPVGTTNLYLTENGLGNTINNFNTSQPIDMTVTGANLTLTQGASNIQILQGNISMDRQGSGTFDLRQQDITLFHNNGANIDGGIGGVNIQGNATFGSFEVSTPYQTLHAHGNISGVPIGTITANAEQNVSIIYANTPSLSGDVDAYFVVQASNVGGLGSPGNVIHANSNGAITFSDAFTFPTSDGFAGQVLSTDGNGALGFATFSSLTNAQAQAYIESNGLNATANLTTTANTSAAHGSFTGATSITATGNVTIGGNLDVTGNINSETVVDLFVEDRNITLQYGAVGSPSANSQIFVDRGDGANTYIKWDEGSDSWKFSNDGSTEYKIPASTSDLAEGTNLYYTDGRADARVNLQTGVNLDLSSKSTSDLSEGTNLYYTNGRVDAQIQANVTGGFGITFNADNSIETTNADIVTAVTNDFESDASIHKIAKLRATEFKIASNATNLANDVYSYSFPNDDGNNNEVLTTDGNGTLSFTAVTATAADTSKTTIKTVIAGEDLAKGDAVYISGGTGDNPEVSKADADDAAKMPVFGVTTEAVTATNTTDLVIYGLVESYDTTGLTTGDSLFVSTTAGALTTTKPTGESALLQTVGKVIKGNSSGGKITVTGAGRVNATPNLNDGNIFIGNGSNESTTATLDTSIVPENTNLYYTTDRANTAIGAYTGAITNLTGDVTTTANLSANNISLSNIFEFSNSQQTGTVFTHYSGNVFFADYPNNAFSGSNIHIADKPRQFGLNTQNLKIGQYETNKIPYVGSFYAGPGILTENLHIEKGLNFGRGVVNLNLFADGSATLGNADYLFSDQSQNLSNVYINIGTGNVNGTANTVVGIKTNLNSDTRLGWHDPISRTTYAYQSEPVFDASTAPNGWYAFGDLAKTTVDETFDANLTISGHTALKGFNETVVALGSQSGNIAALAAFNAANGSIFTMTATGGIEISQIPNAVAGSSYTLKITQDGTGSHALTSTFKYQGGDKTLTTAAGNTDVISVVYDGTDYLATLSKDYY